MDLVPVDRDPSAPGTVLLSGIPGSGKSTVAAALAATGLTAHADAKGNDSAGA